MTAPALPQDIDALAAHVWPHHARRDDNGALSLAGCGVADLADRFGTPLYIYDEDDVRRRARTYRDAYPDADVFYAGKAFLSKAICRWVTEEGLGIDVATGGELAVALAAGVGGERLLLHGNNKSIEEIERAIDARVRFIVLDSMEEIARVRSVAAARGVRQDVLIRATVGVEAHTHEFIATAHEDQKFGFSVASGAALVAARAVLDSPELNLRGLHSHIGSQIFDASGFAIAAERLVALAVRIRSEFAVVLDYIDLGGGMGIAYLDSDDPLDVAAMANDIVDTVTKLCAQADFPLPQLAVEPGRAIVGTGGVTLYRVGTVKPVQLDAGQSRLYVSVDGGMSDNIRTALYGADYTAVVANRTVGNAPVVLARVVGKHCESGDVVVRDVWLPQDIAAGDLLLVAATGAYCRSMSSQYNHVPRPAVVAVREGQARLILRRETEEDLLRLEA